LNDHYNADQRMHFKYDGKVSIDIFQESNQ